MKSQSWVSLVDAVRALRDVRGGVSDARPVRCWRGHAPPTYDRANDLGRRPMSHQNPFMINGARRFRRWTGAVPASISNTAG